jgi:hypothetical protein
MCCVGHHRSMTNHHDVVDLIGQLLDEDTDERVAKASALTGKSDAVLQDEVTLARANGRSWQSIADELGITRQAVQKRFGRTES